MNGTKLKVLCELATQLEESADNGGCSSDLTVVGAVELTNLLRAISELKEAAAADQRLPEDLEGERICERLLSSEEHTEDSAIPAVAEDAVEVIGQLRRALCTAQGARLQAETQVSAARQFISRVAQLQVGEDDSASALRRDLHAVAEQARVLQGGL